MSLNGNSDETNGYNSVIKNGVTNNINLVKAVIPPIGSIMPWLKTFANTPSLPDGWAECDGSTISDSDSPFDGQDLPDLNGDNAFLRGNSTSWASGAKDGGEATTTLTEADIAHKHPTYGSTDGTLSQTAVGGWSSGGSGDKTGDVMNFSTNTLSNEPPYYNIVWIIRIK